MRRTWCAAVVAALVAGRAVPAQTPPEQPRALETFAALGLENLTLGPRAEVDPGNAGANRGTATLRRHAAVAGSVLADTIDLAGLNRVGSLFCHFVRGPLRFGCTTLADPVVDVSRLSFVQVRPGVGDVAVPAHTSTAPVPAGAYGAVSVGPHGRLLLAGGTYDLSTLDVGRRATVLCAAACRIRVRERAMLRPHAELGPVPPLTATAVRVDVESQGRKPAFATASAAIVGATVYAPGGDVVLGARGRFEGAFVGRTVTVGPRARVKLASAF